MKKEEFNLQSFLSQTGVNIASETTSHYQCRCFNPAHNDKTPSLGIMKDWPHLYKCFGCGMTGNVYTMHRVLTGTGFEKNYKTLPSLLNVNKPTKEIPRGIFNHNGELRDPRDNVDVMNWLRKERNCSIDFIDFFNISWTKRFTVNANPELDYKGTTFYNRAVVPIYEKDTLVCYEGRDYTGLSKIKVLYPKNSKTDLLFNFDRIDKDREVILVEGIFDMPVVWDLYPNTIALLGANLGKNQIQQLKELKHLTVIPDNDDAGLRLIDDLDEVLTVDFDIAFLPPDIKDPGKASKNDIKKAMQNKINVVDYMVGEYMDDGKIRW